MLNYKIRALIAAGFGFAFIVFGWMNMLNSGDTTENTANREAFGTLLLTLGAVFLGVMASISLSGQSTEEITRNVISILKHEGLIPSNSQLRINDELQVVKPVSSTITINYDIEKDNEMSKEKTEVYVRPDGITVYPDGMEVDRKGTILKMGSNYRP